MNSIHHLTECERDTLLIPYKLSFPVGKFIHDGEILKFRLYGRPCTVKICGIHIISEHRSGTVESITTSLNELQIHPADHPPRAFYKVDRDTKIVVVRDGKEAAVNCTRTSLSNVGGLDHQISAIQEIISLHSGNCKPEQLAGKKRS